MKPGELKEIIKKGEDSRTQFKLTITSPDQLASDLVAFSNSNGGVILVGVNDKGKVIGLTPDEIRKINQLISNVSSQNVKNPINPVTENIKVDRKIVIVINIQEGIDKPYFDNQGLIWVKSGSDKRKVTGKEELRRLFQSSDLLYADEVPVKNTSEKDIDIFLFRKFYEETYNSELEKANLTLSKILENLGLMKKGNLTLAGVLLFSKNPEIKKPLFIIKAISYFGNMIEGNEYRDSIDIAGSFFFQFKEALAFILRNLKRIQNGKNFNVKGELEVSQVALEELLANALIHRDYFRNAAIRIFIFDNRVEIISPGSLPNNLTIENVKSGVSIIRNPVIASFANKMIPYRGLGSGILRALKEQPDIELINEITTEQFKVVIPRPLVK